MGPSQVPGARALRNSTARNTPSRCHEAVGAFRRGLEPACDGASLSVAQGGGGRQERRGVSFGQNYGNSGQGAGVGPRLTRKLLHQHSPSACPCRAARWTDSGRRPSSRASARPLRRSLGGRVDVVELFPTGVGRPGSIWYPNKGLSQGLRPMLFIRPSAGRNPPSPPFGKGGDGGICSNAAVINII